MTADTSTVLDKLAFKILHENLNLQDVLRDLKRRTVVKSMEYSPTITMAAQRLGYKRTTLVQYMRGKYFSHVQ